MSTAEIPLFPLNTVLFPGGPLPLRIFETRYTDMVRRCMREQSAFGVVLIRAGAEVGEVSEDDSKRGQDKVQKLTDDFIKKIDQAHDKKVEEIMEV